jgi:hypothetical protein
VPSPFSVGKKYQNPTAAPDAMKGSARVKSVIAAPVNAEQRLSTVSASVSDTENFDKPFE